MFHILTIVNLLLPIFVFVQKSSLPTIQALAFLWAEDTLIPY